MKAFLCVTALAACAAAAIPAMAAEATFERNLSFNGRPDLTISIGAGNIHLDAGPAGQIHIVGHVRSTWGGSDEQVRDIAAHPPIEQTGNIVRIGAHQNNLQHISVDYDIEAPADAYLSATSGSGNIAIEGVGTDATLETGSGNIHATGLRESFKADTGSGNIYAEQIGNGDVKAETGSGNIELRNLNGALRAHTGSGNIKASGKPAGPWKMETGSGDVEIWTGNSAFTLDAGCGSGSIESDREITSGRTADRHHLSGKVSGGGPAVRIETGSGSIRVH